MTKIEAINAALAAAGTADHREALRTLLADRAVSDMVTLDFALPRNWFDGMTEERYAGMDDAQVAELLIAANEAA